MHLLSTSCYATKSREKAEGSRRSNETERYIVATQGGERCYAVEAPLEDDLDGRIFSHTLENRG